MSDDAHACAVKRHFVDETTYERLRSTLQTYGHLALDDSKNQGLEGTAAAAGWRRDWTKKGLELVFTCHANVDMKALLGTCV
jgi:hypothetical protein